MILPVMLPVIAKWTSSELLRSPGSDCRRRDRTPAPARHHTNLVASLICQPFAARFPRADNQRNDGDPVHAWATASSGRAGQMFKSTWHWVLIHFSMAKDLPSPANALEDRTDNRSSRMRVACLGHGLSLDQ